MDGYVVFINSVGRPRGRSTRLRIILGGSSNDAGYGVAVAADESIVSRDFSHNGNALGSDAALEVIKTSVFGRSIGESGTHAGDIGAQVLEKVTSLLGVLPTNVAWLRTPLEK